jgi:hypothetical protein
MWELANWRRFQMCLQKRLRFGGVWFDIFLFQIEICLDILSKMRQVPDSHKNYKVIPDDHGMFRQIHLQKGEPDASVKPFFENPDQGRELNIPLGSLNLSPNFQSNDQNHQPSLK